MHSNPVWSVCLFEFQRNWKTFAHCVVYPGKSHITTTKEMWVRCFIWCVRWERIAAATSHSLHWITFSLVTWKWKKKKKLPMRPQYHCVLTVRHHFQESDDQIIFWSSQHNKPTFFLTLFINFFRSYFFIMLI